MLGLMPRQLQTGTAVLLLISAVNLILIVCAAFYPSRELDSPSGVISNNAKKFGFLSLVVAALSQVLYLVLTVTWFYNWINFYPGNSTQTFVLLAGLLLSAVAFVTALFGTGLERAAGIVVGVTTFGLWVLSAMASVVI
jgi:hypothetical protein